MKFLFIYPDIDIYYTNAGRFQRGISYLSSWLKKAGHEVDLLWVRELPRKEEFLSKVKTFKPDIIGYSSISSQTPVVKKLAAWTKELKIFTIWGGVHASLDPENSVKADGIDAVCIGEADIALPEFVDVFAKGGAIDKVESFYVKLRDNGIVKNPIAPLIENLDQAPFPDYDLFPYNITDDFIYSNAVSVLASRGCPFNCSYCANHALRSLYPNKGKYMRIRSVDNVISEIEFLLKKYPDAKEVRFADDTLSSSKEWFREFCAEYKRRIGLPYATNERPEFVTEEKAVLYKESGCVCIAMGIESGNEFVRHKMMNRKVKTETIIKAFHLMHEQGIKVNAFNVLGMPNETLSSALDTVKLNARCKPTLFFNAYFHPFIATDAYIMSKRMGLINEDFELPTSLAERPVVKLNTMTEAELIFCHKYFSLLVWVYKFLFKLSGEKESKMVRFFDKIIMSKYIPRRVLNRLYFTEVDIKKKYPTLSKHIVKIVRKITKPYTYNPRLQAKIR